MAQTEEVPFLTLVAWSTLAVLTQALVQSTNESDHKTDPAEK